MNFSMYRKQISGLVKEISATLLETFKKISEDYHITCIQYEILSLVYEVKSISIGDIANKMFMDKGNISSMCKKLEKNELLIRTRNQKDERIVEVCLTKKGNNMIKMMNDKLDIIFKKVMEEEEKEELDNITKALNKINEMIKKVDEQCIQ